MVMESATHYFINGHMQSKANQKQAADNDGSQNSSLPDINTDNDEFKVDNGGDD